MIWNDLRKLKSKDWSERRAAAQALGEAKAASALKPLIAALKDKDMQVREAVVEALGKIGGPDTIGPLVAMLIDERLWLREAAGRALDQADRNWARSPAARSAVPKLVMALYDEDTDIKTAAEEALGDIADPGAVDPLLRTLRQAGEVTVVEALGKIRDRRAIEPLVTALRDFRPWMQKAVEAALDRIDSRWPRSAIVKQALPDFIAALEDKNFLVRVAAARALGRIGDQRAFEPLLKALQQGGYVRHAAEQSLNLLQPDWKVSEAARKMQPDFIRELKDPSHEVRYGAARQLEKIGDAQAVQPLIETLVDPVSQVRKAAADAVEAIAPDWPESEAARAALPALADALKHTDAEVHHTAAEALGRIRDPRAVQPLIDALPTVGAVAASALGSIGDPRALGPLVSILKHRSLFLRLAVERALDRIDSGWAHSPAAAEAVPAIIKAFLECPDWEVRRAAADALGKIGDPRAVEALLLAQKDEDREVKNLAAQALKKIRRKTG